MEEAFLRCGSQKLHLTKAVTTVGSAHDCDLQLNEATVDAQHALIERSHGDNCFFMRDLNSEHGSYVNNVPIHGATTPLQYGDVIRFGYSNHFFRFEPTTATVSRVAANTSRPQTTATSRWGGNSGVIVQPLITTHSLSSTVEPLPQIGRSTTTAATTSSSSRLRLPSATANSMFAGAYAAASGSRPPTRLPPPPPPLPSQSQQHHHQQRVRMSTAAARTARPLTAATPSAFTGPVWLAAYPQDADNNMINDRDATRSVDLDSLSDASSVAFDRSSSRFPTRRTASTTMTVAKKPNRSPTRIIVDEGKDIMIAAATEAAVDARSKLASAENDWTSLQRSYENTIDALHAEVQALTEANQTMEETQEEGQTQLARANDDCVRLQSQLEGLWRVLKDHLGLGTLQRDEEGEDVEEEEERETLTSGRVDEALSQYETELQSLRAEVAREREANEEQEAAHGLFMARMREGLALSLDANEEETVRALRGLVVMREELSGRVNELESAVRDERENVAAQRRANEELTERLARLDEQCAQLEGTLEVTKREMEDIERQLGEVREQSRTQTDQTAEERRRREEEWERERSGMEHKCAHQVTTVETQLSEMREEAEQWCGKAKESTEQAEQLQRLLVDRDGKLRSATQSVLRLFSESGDAIPEAFDDVVTLVLDHVTRYVGVTHETKRALEQAQQEQEAQRARVDTLEEQLSNAQQAHQEQEKILNTVHAELERVDTERKQSDADAQDMHEQMGRLIEFMKTERTQSAEQISRLEAQLVAAEEVADRLRDYKKALGRLMHDVEQKQCNKSAKEADEVPMDHEDADEDEDADEKSVSWAENARERVMATMQRHRATMEYKEEAIRRLVDEKRDVERHAEQLDGRVKELEEYTRKQVDAGHKHRAFCERLVKTIDSEWVVSEHMLEERLVSAVARMASRSGTTGGRHTTVSLKRTGSRGGKGGGGGTIARLEQELRIAQARLSDMRSEVNEQTKESMARLQEEVRESVRELEHVVRSGTLREMVGQAVTLIERSQQNANNNHASEGSDDGGVLLSSDIALVREQLREREAEVVVLTAQLNSARRVETALSALETQYEQVRDRELQHRSSLKLSQEAFDRFAEQSELIISIFEQKFANFCTQLTRLMAPSTRTADDETELIRLIVELVQENRDLLGGGKVVRHSSATCLVAELDVQNDKLRDELETLKHQS